MARSLLQVGAGLLMLALCAYIPVSHAQGGTLARIVVIQPKPGQAADFEIGYKRHLEWHRKNGDPWRWYGWTFVLGHRLGQFMDGTFDHTSAELDAAIKPAEDRADNALNVTPYADFLSHGVYERQEAISRGNPLPDKSEMLVLETYEVVPGQERAFENALARSTKQFRIERYTCYKLRVGGSQAEYLVMRAATSVGDATSLQMIEFPPGIVAQATSELLKYQPALSYEP